jgi:hypothetical protein
MARTRRSGRKDNTERIRDVVALFGSLSRRGDSVSIEAISNRLGVSIEEAHKLMNIVCCASGEEGSHLPISSNEDETEFTLQYAGSTGRPIRLTHAETIAVQHAFDVCGIPLDDSLRQRVSDQIASPDVALEDIRRELGEGNADANLLTCIWSEVEERSIAFDYLGLKDSTPKPRHARVRSVKRSEDTFYIYALDLDLMQNRNFRIDRMSNVILQDVMRLPEQIQDSEEQYVRLIFTDKTYLSLFSWPGIRVLSELDNVIQAEIPYFGDRSDWLIKRICACGGAVTTDDENIMDQARALAERLLEYGTGDD